MEKDIKKRIPAAKNNTRGMFFANESDPADDNPNQDEF